MRRSSLLFAVMAVAVIVMPATATVIHVPSQQSTIQGAMYMASNGDTILVAAGTYSEHFSYLGKNILLKSEDGPEATIIQAANANRPIVRFQSGEPRTATLEGFTVREAYDSSAVVVIGSGATLKGNIFINNTSEMSHVHENGGGIYAADGDTLVVLDNTFVSNRINGSGAGVYALNMAVIIEGNEFRNNWALTGSAIRLERCPYTIVDHNLMAGNYGGAARFHYCEGEFFNNTVTQDTADGLVIYESSGFNIYNNVIVNNVGWGIYIAYSSGCQATYNDIWGNSNGSYFGVAPGIGSISADPLFFGGDPFSYYLSFDSPCINAGDPASPLDPDGSVADMGAYYLGYGVGLGFIAGTVLDSISNPLDGASIIVQNTPYQETTDWGGNYIIRGLLCDRTYDLYFYHDGYVDTMLTGVTVSLNDTTFLPPIQMRLFEAGCIAGAVLDSLSDPIAQVQITILSTSFIDSTDADGHFMLCSLPIDASYTIQFIRGGYRDTMVADVLVNRNETTFLDDMILQRDPSQWYIQGDINGDGDATPLADIIYAVDYFLGGPPPPFVLDCGSGYPWHVAGDINGSCNFNGLDVSLGVVYWQGGPPMAPCPSCPLPQPDLMLAPSGPDPGLPDSIIVGNLDLTPILAHIGDTVTIPIWIKNDEPVPAVNIPLAADTGCISAWLGGTILDPLLGFNSHVILSPELDQPSPGYSSQALMGWKLFNDPEFYRLNTNGVYQQAASFTAVIALNADLNCSTIQIIPGSHSRAGVVAFCDSIGVHEWSPAVIGGQITVLWNRTHMELSPVSFTDTAICGSAVTNPLYISNVGAMDLNYRLQGGDDWLSGDPSSGTVHPGGSDTASIILDASALLLGTHFSQITVISNDSTNRIISLPVTLAVQSGFGSLEGTIADHLLNPLGGVIVTCSPPGVCDTTDEGGHFTFSIVPSCTDLSLHLSHPCYSETTLTGIFVSTNETTSLNNLRFAPPAAGYVTGQVVDDGMAPLAGTVVRALNTSYLDTVDIDGHYMLSRMPTNRSYNIRFYHIGYADTTVANLMIGACETVTLDIQLQSVETGFIAGTVIDGVSNPLPGVHVYTGNDLFQDTTDTNGQFALNWIPSNQAYDISFYHDAFASARIADVFVNTNDTTFMDPVQLWDVPTGYNYILGDANGDGDATPLADMAYMRDFFLGGPPPPYGNCPCDLNGNCSFNGADLIYGVNYWMGGPPPPGTCDPCAVPLEDPVLAPSGSDPGFADGVIVGNLDLTPIVAIRGDTVTIPIWVKTDEQVPAMIIPLAADTTLISRWIGGTVNNPVSSWYTHNIMPQESNQPMPGYASQTLMAWMSGSSDGPCLNTQGSFQQIASFRAIIAADIDSSRDMIEIIPGNRSRAGGLAFCDSMGFTEWVPGFADGLIALIYAEPDIAILPTALYDTVYAGQTASWPLLISDEGLANLIYGLHYDPALLTLSADTGSVAPSQTDTILVTFSAASLPEGTYSTEISVNSNDSDEGVLTIPVTIVVRELGNCIYVVGDANSNEAFNGLDVTYSVAYFKGGPPPHYECECTPGNTWYVAGDVNQSCTFNGLDVTYMVAYFKGGPPPHPCPDCPPAGR
jgi:parallel beta-helix repeat protein